MVSNKAILFFVLVLVKCAASRGLPAQNELLELKLHQTDVQLFQSVSEDSTKLHPDVGLNVVQMIRKHGYPCEIHTIRTEDDYVLTMQRIPHGRNNSGSADQKRPVALLMHGLLSSAADWIAMGPGLSFGYILADLGYDVWIGNARGNTWSRKHMYLDPKNDKEKFWDFSWHEIGYYDLPAKIDHILKVTGQEKLYYFGHSQGCTVFFVMASTRPEYNQKIQLSSMLAPPVYMAKVPNPFLKLISQFEKSIDWLSRFIGLHEFLPNNDLYTLIGKTLCHEEAFFKELCANVVFLIAGYDSQQLNRTMIPVVLSNLPAGAASKQLLHYAQGIKTGKFRQYNYGMWKNLAKYGSISPPKYDLKKITAPVAIYYSSNDLFVNKKDVDKLAKELKNLANKYLVEYKLFNHVDFLLAKDVVPLLYNEVVATMKRYV